MFFSRDLIDQVIDRNDIVDVITSFFPLKKYGGNYKMCCPFHNEKTPSFVVNPQKQIFHCFGCGVGGNVVSFIMKQENCDFPDAIRSLADKAGIILEPAKSYDSKADRIKEQIKLANNLALNYFHRNLLSDRRKSAREAREYLKNRSIDLKIVQDFQLGFALDGWDGLLCYMRSQGVKPGIIQQCGLFIAQQGKQGFYDRFRKRIIFPIFDYRGDCVAFGARSMEKDNPAKYINSPETNLYIKGRHFYGFNWAKQALMKEDFAVVVEGYLDFITPFHHGVHNVIASLGTALTLDQIRLLKRYTKNVFMLFDADPAGEAASLRSLDLLVEEGMNVKVAALAEGTDPDSYVRSYGIENFRQQLDRAESVFDFKLNFLLRHFDIKQVEHRAEICRQILSTITRFKNAIIRAEYIKQLSARIDVPEDALLSEMKKFTQKDRVSVESRKGPLTQSESHKARSIRSVEKELLKLMLERQEYIPLTKESVDMDDFLNPCVRKVVQQIFELYDGGHLINASTVVAYFEDRFTQELVSGLMASEWSSMVDKPKLHRDCIRRLKKDRLSLRRKELIQEMETAQKQHDYKKQEELLLAFNQLIKES